MKEHDEERLKKLLRQALPPVVASSEPGHDLWPDVLRRMNQKSAIPPWYDLALIAGLVGLAVLFPAAIPLFLYYL